MEFSKWVNEPMQWPQSFRIHFGNCIDPLANCGNSIAPLAHCLIASLR